LRVLTVVDSYSRFSPAVESCINFCAADVVEVLEIGCPAAIRVYQDCEFSCMENN
jgi:putative transposase